MFGVSTYGKLCTTLENLILSVKLVQTKVNLKCSSLRLYH